MPFFFFFFFLKTNSCKRVHTAVSSPAQLESPCRSARRGGRAVAPYSTVGRLVHDCFLRPDRDLLYPFTQSTFGTLPIDKAGQAHSSSSLKVSTVLALEHLAHRITTGLTVNQSLPHSQETRILVARLDFLSLNVCVHVRKWGNERKKQLHKTFQRGMKAMTRISDNLGA